MDFHSRQVAHDLFSSITQNKWLAVEYQNKSGGQTSYWIGVCDIDEKHGTLSAEGFHLTKKTFLHLDRIYITSILQTHVIDESFYAVPENLKNKIRENPGAFQKLFGTVANLRILDYLEECVNLNCVPYKSDYSLLEHFDADAIADGEYKLNDEQFSHITQEFHLKAKNEHSFCRTKYLCLNMLSVHTSQGLYLLAYKKLLLDIKKRALVADDHITICKRFKVGKEKELSIAQFLDFDDFYLLEDFEANAEKIKDAVSKSIHYPHEKVDDLPYLIPLSRDVAANLRTEFNFIKKQLENETAAEPLQAFFGKLTKPPIRRKKFPLALLNKRANLDQLLAINNAMKYPLAYIQGPPGTGKTSTILNTILTAFFNGKTVLFSSFNNHPIDSVCAALENISHRGKKIPFPIFRIGNKEKTIESLNAWREKFLQCKDTPIFSETLERNKESEIAKSEQLTELLKSYEEKIELEERKKAIEQLLEINTNMTYQFDLQGRQLAEVNQRLSQIGEIKNEDAISLVYEGGEKMMQYFYYTSAKFIKRLSEPKNKDLREIILADDSENDGRLKRFSEFLKSEENIFRLTKIFPIVAATCISAEKIGTPNVYFDMTIIDEASQCDTAHSLLPILRGKQLMLVGDPQQLNPVILLDAKDNDALKRMYKIPDEYDFIKNSVYKTFLASDSVSKEILLRHHYRCAKEIIEFNNKKYYANQLEIESAKSKNIPLAFCDVPNDRSYEKNVAPLEAEEIIRYAKENPAQKIGVITPFVKQKRLIEDLIKKHQLKNISCGTVHAFQGDEKDVVLFSLALTNKTNAKTYEWINSNKELINVATSRAKEKLVLVASENEIERLHKEYEKIPAQKETKCDDVFELKNYIKKNGDCKITPRQTASRALGIKPYSTKTEEEFLTTLSHALDNVIGDFKKCSVKKEVGISAVFEGENIEPSLFYTGRFDFVIYERDYDRKERPVLAIELDGKEHLEDIAVKKRDRTKNEICRRHHLQLIRVDNTYARRYHYIKEVLEEFFARQL